MKCLTVTVFLLAIVGAGSSMQAVTARGDVAHLPSELIANPGRYDGKHVTLRGYVVIGAESRNIFDSEAGYNDAHGACLGLDGPKAAFHIFHRGYSKKISGTFRRKLCGENDVCLFWCSASGIELDKGINP
jgi:hypothetical protein